MASGRDTKRVADATTKLGRTIAEALRSWAQEVGADDIASDVLDRVREGFDVVLDRAKEAVGKAQVRAKEHDQEGEEHRQEGTEHRQEGSAEGAQESQQRRPTEDDPQDTG